MMSVMHHIHVEEERNRQMEWKWAEGDGQWMMIVQRQLREK